MNGQTLKRFPVFTNQMLPLVSLHPLLIKIAAQTLKLVIENCGEFRLCEQNETVYFEDANDMQIFIPIFGSLRIWSRQNGILGRINVGQPAGEECFCDSKYINRIDSCVTNEVGQCGLLIIDRELYHDIKTENTKDHFKDLNMLDSIFRRNFFIKKHWRNEGGIKNVKFGKIQQEYTQQRYKEPGPFQF
eukprot:403368078